MSQTQPSANHLTLLAAWNGRVAALSGLVLSAWYAYTDSWKDHYNPWKHFLFVFRKIHRNWSDFGLIYDLLLAAMLWFAGS